MDVLTEADGYHEKTSGVRNTLRGLAGMAIMSPWYVFKFCIICFYTLPVSFFLVFSTIVINPSILSEHRMDLFQLVFDHYDKLFQYSITITVVVSLLVVTMTPVFYQFFLLVKEMVLSRLFK